MVGYHEGVDESGGYVRYGVRQEIGPAGFTDEPFRIGAVADEADVVRAVDGPAEVFLAAQAHVALAAVQVGPEYDAVANLERAVAGIGDDAAEFVAHSEIGNIFLVPALAGLPHVDVAAADTAG